MAVEIRAATYAALRTALAAGTYQAGQMVFVESIDGTNTNGAGIFKVKYDAGGGFVDDGGVTIASADGKWAAERVFDGPFRAEWFGMSPEEADSAQSLRDALSAASLAGKNLCMPAGIYSIASKVVVPRLTLTGSADKTILVPLITNGDAVLEVASGTNHFDLKDFRVSASVNTADFLSGSQNGQNCIGIKVASSVGGAYSARYAMSNIIVTGCKVGYDIHGYIGSLENIWALYCEKGFKGVELNSVRAHLRFEGCRKDLEIDTSNGLHLDQPLFEGGVHQFGLLASTIDACYGLQITAPYFEQVRDEPFLIVGGLSECRSVNFTAASIAVENNAANDYDSALIKFDRVKGLIVSGNFSTGFHENAYQTTPNTLDILDLSTPGTLSWIPNDASGQLAPLRNHFPNPTFDLWFRGWPEVAPVRGVISKEISIVRRGPNAVKFTATSSETSAAYVQWRFSDSSIGVYLRNRTVTFCAWIWVPDISEFDPNGTNLQDTLVYLLIYRDGTGGGSGTSESHRTVRGAWNLMHYAIDVPADATRIDVGVQMQKSSGAFNGNEYIVIDSAYLFDGPVNHFALRHGWIADSEINAVSGYGGKMVLRSNSVPSDADQVYESGDRIEKLSVTAGGSPGWVCTTGGAGGTAVFKALPSVAA